eukprot:COSAG05_NODE_5128_length_1257_cov_40.241796_2_plen_47_part_01
MTRNGHVNGQHTDGVVNLGAELPWETDSSDSSWEPDDTDEEMGSLLL